MIPKRGNEMTKNRTTKLNLFMLASGYHHGAWRHPDVPRDQI